MILSFWNKTKAVRALLTLVFMLLIFLVIRDYAGGNITYPPGLLWQPDVDRGSITQSSVYLRYDYNSRKIIGTSAVADRAEYCSQVGCNSLGQLCLQNDGTIWEVVGLTPCTWTDKIANAYIPVRADCEAYLNTKTSTDVKAYTCINSTNATAYYLTQSGEITALGCATSYLNVRINGDTGDSANTSVNFISGVNTTIVRGGSQSSPTVTIDATNVPTPGGSVTSETTVGLVSAPGTVSTFSRSDHTHGTPGIRTQFPGYYIDFFVPNVNAMNPWYGGILGSGTMASIAATADHPGIVEILSAASASSGGNVMFSPSSPVSSILLAGTEITELIFQIPTTTNTTIRFGFQDSTGAGAAPTDGAWINIAGTTLDGRTASNSSSSTTGTTYTISGSTWYRAKIVVNTDASQVDYYLYDAAGTELWTNNLTANIPTGAGRETSHGVVATTSGSSAVALIDLDFMSLTISRALVR